VSHIGVFEAAARLFGFPLIRRELIALLRTRRAFWLLVATVALSGLLPILEWPAEGAVLGDPSTATSLLSAFLTTQLALGVLVIPAFTAGAISGERERGTYDLLYTTLLSPFAIIFSKVTASVSYVILLLAGSAPAACVLYLLGGVEFGAILTAYLVTFGAVVSTSVLCVQRSMGSRRTSHALLKAVPGMIVVISLGFASVSSLLEGSGKLEPFLRVIWFLAIPLVFLSTLLSEKSKTRDVALPRPPDPIWPKTRWLFQRQPRTWLMKAILEGGLSSAPLSENSVFLKEMRTEIFGRVAFRRLVFWGSLCLFIFLILSLPNQGTEAHVSTVSGTAVFFMALLLPGVAATSFTREIEPGNLDFLRGTLLSWREILRGKFLANLVSCAGILAAALWGALMALVAGEAWLFLGSAGYLCMTYLLLTAVVTFLSAVSKRTTTALILSYVAVVGVLLLPPLVFATVSSKVWIYLGVELPELAFVGFIALHGAAAYALLRLSEWYLEKFRARDV
jgi:ABC-type transport system involved in multi-copper enzyme maturation permease subunit